MEMIVHNNYVLKNKPDKHLLKKYGFKYNKRISDSDVDVYSIRFPVLSYNNVATVDGEIAVDMENGKIILNAYNSGTNNCYPSFYEDKCYEVYEPIIKKINSAFEEKFNHIGVVKAA